MQKRALWLILGALLLTAIVAVSFLVGYVSSQHQELFIYGPSMAEQFCGRHGVVACPTCQHVLCFDLEEVDFPERIVCPNCGELVPEGTRSEVRSGDRVRIAKNPSPLERFDVVAFRLPNEADKLGVKRILGLPGEQVSIRGGDLYIDGKLLRKNLMEERATATSVHADSDGVGLNLPDSRWKTAGDPSAWHELRTENVTRQFVFRQEQPTSEIEWLTYHHGKSFDSPGEGTATLLDNDSYNQSLARELNEVFDYRLLLMLGRTSKPGSRFVVKMHDGWRKWEVEITDQWILLRQGEEIVRSAPRPTSDRSQLLEVSLCDDQLRVALDEVEQLSVAIQPVPGTVRRLPVDFVAVGAAGAGRVIHSLTLLRDIYYLRPHGDGQSWMMDRPLGPDEYFVLGDNPPVSIDGRQFGPVSKGAILGKIAPSP